MQRILKIFQQWLPFAVLTVALSGLVYLAVQQVLRQSANDPQIQLAEDAANALAQGETTTNILSGAPTVDIAKSLASFLIIYDESGLKVIAGSGQLHDSLPMPPLGVFDHARTDGQNRVTWQPEPSVRIASVIQHVTGGNGGFVLAGRSLRQSEARTDQLMKAIGLAMFVTLAALGVVISVNEFIFSTWLSHPNRER